MKKIFVLTALFLFNFSWAYGQLSQGVIKISGTKGEQGNDMKQTKDGGYVIAGITNTYGYTNDTTDFYIIKLDSLGGLQWTRTIGGAKEDYANSIIQTKDGGYLITGETYSFGVGSYITSNVYLVKLDASGTLKW